MNVSRQIGWSNESNLLYQILKQLNRLTSVLFGLKEAATPKYKMYTALLTQGGGSNILQIGSGLLTIGVTYQILEDAGPSGWDFTNVGAPNNNVGTYFVATGTTPNSWTNAELQYNTGAPVVTVLENTIGNIYWIYEGGVGTPGQYSGQILNVNQEKLVIFFGAGVSGDKTAVVQAYSDPFGVWIDTSISSTGLGADDILNNTPIEIRVYN